MPQNAVPQQTKTSQPPLQTSISQQLLLQQQQQQQQKQQQQYGNSSVPQQQQQQPSLSTQASKPLPITKSIAPASIGAMATSILQHDQHVKTKSKYKSKITIKLLIDWEYHTHAILSCSPFFSQTMN